MIDAKGRCCGRKPLHYKRGLTTTLRRPQLFCCRCNAAYDPETREQIANWAWKPNEHGKLTNEHGKLTRYNAGKESGHG